ncbi:sterigmatocystin 8-O-methyltransferase precursor [Aspergillus heteromorphus CBS 117.55]|uniref:Sterigmatocystin 8-O-methyltransferase n=1 Tax=Aspergillus heteromorphus CBS 117.55 TaxID=1448321 RepID=A0A317WSB7_9EURO|nr:sterigmatocystin 8-O-methyltransferase precursor [Aspergillus heteromorphus CBS 117.55]PWY89354.1 sterigmatocystin 8-O-methyltransferase precursor [Aspergillus heteromorphus CBS 117.55]
MSLESQISALTGVVRSNKESLDYATRLKAIKAAYGLLAALKSSAETVIHDVVRSVALPMTIRMGVQLDVFRIISNYQGQGTTIQQIAERSGASVLLVDQIMRLLAATGYVSETDIQTYEPSPLTSIMTDPIFEATARVCFDILNRCTTAAPEFFRKNNNQLPRSARDTPFQLAMNTDLGYFDWLGHNPDLSRDFQQWMTLKRKSTPSWLDWFDVQGAFVDGFDSDSADDSVLIVDVGGGEGHYLRALKEKIPSLPGRLVLQDLPHVISSIKAPPRGVELMSYDFFTPQPVKGARAYYMHCILHDWGDQQAREILRNTIDAMEPGYSRLIINEYIIPSKNCDLVLAYVSITMMVQTGAFERSETQWRELLNSVGLRDITFHQPLRGGEGIIEVIVTK